MSFIRIQEWEDTWEHDMQNYTQAPYVGQMSVDLAEEDLRRAVGDGAKAILTRLSMKEDFRKAKVDEFWDNVLPVNTKHDVFKLNVSVSDAYRM